MSETMLSPRRRRLRLTATLLAIVGVIGGISGIALHLRMRPTEYRPDERPEDITSMLAASLPTNAPSPRLAEVSGEAGLDGFRNFAGKRTSQLPEDMGPGLAWGDFDNDGDDDLFLVSAGGSLDVADNDLFPSQLFANLGNGSFRLCTGFPELRIRGMGAAWGDFDGDGFLDLAVSGYNALRLFRNDRGTGRFLPDDRIPNLPGFWAGLAWGDIDNDRRLDLYVCNYVEYTPDATLRDLASEQLGTAVPYTLNPASFAPGKNALFHQNSKGSFTNVAAALGVENPEGRSLGVLWHDFDLDGDLDVYVANDVSDNVLYENLGGRFRDLSHAAHVADYRSAMGLAAADFDRDGDDDMFITHWVAQENGFYENLWADFNHPPSHRVPPVKEGGDRIVHKPSAVAVPADGNEADIAEAPHREKGARFPLQFIDIADRVGLGQISLDQVGWGTEFVDMDHDGWLDILVANGSTLEIEGAVPRSLKPEMPYLFWNRRGSAFHNLAPLSAPLRRKTVGRGLACADWDGDGDLDFAIADLGEGVRLIRNDMSAGAWLQVRLRSRNSAGEANGFGHGTTAVAWVDGVPLRRSVNSVSYLSQSSSVLHWGLGSGRRIDRLDVHWLAGETQSFVGLEAGGCYELREKHPEIGRVARLAGDVRSARVEPSPNTTQADVAVDPRTRVRRFWELQRAGMNALKVEKSQPEAIRLLRDALAIDPNHQDSRYYLAQALVGTGDTEGALRELAILQGIAPASHRAWQQWGVLRVQSTTDPAHLMAAEEALQRAYRLNPEETGAPLALAAVALIRGQSAVAEQRLVAVTRTNPRSAGAHFLIAYLAWKRGELARARELLAVVRESRGPDWQPIGATSEGDVRRKQHTETVPLSSFWEEWDGNPDLDRTFQRLEQRLSPAGLSGVDER
jgi:tetratricopeptide (TPR) repeat protein